MNPGRHRKIVPAALCGLLLGALYCADAPGAPDAPTARAARCRSRRISETLFAVQETGPLSNRVNIVFIGDGFRREELGAWATHVDDMTKRLFSAESPPFDRYRNFFNVYRVDLVSKDSGIDDPQRGVTVDTALDGGNSCIDWTVGQCMVDWAKTEAAIRAAVGQMPVHWRLVGLNTKLYLGGSHHPRSGSLAVYGIGDPRAFFILAHEAAEAFLWLGDEYGAEWTNAAPYTGGEPPYVNLTIDPSGRKWEPWRGFAQPALGGPVGTYEGGGKCARGIYRPTPQSRENHPEYPLSAIGKEAAIQHLYALVAPCDGCRPAEGQVPPEATLNVTVIDPAVLLVEWLVDGRYAGSGESFTLAAHRLSKGTHTIEARVHDEVLDHAFSDNAHPHPLDLVRRGDERLRQVLRWQTVIP